MPQRIGFVGVAIFDSFKYYYVKTDCNIIWSWIHITANQFTLRGLNGSEIWPSLCVKL